jgi:hypothetical protein
MSTQTAEQDLASTYTDPVRRLLGLGQREIVPGDTWADYRAEFGFTAADIPQLIALATDKRPNGLAGDDPAVWGPLHAWRALGQLEAAEAIEPLLESQAGPDCDDWAAEDLPEIFALIGPPAIPPLERALQNPRRLHFAADSAMAGLRDIAQRYADCRDRCVAILAGVLDADHDSTPEINASAVSNLLDLHAVEAIAAIRAAFGRNEVDLSVAGDIEDVEIEFGLRNARTTPRPPNPLLARLFERIPDLAPPPEPARQFVKQKVGRNDPCPCGSGKKYKKCCL